MFAALDSRRKKKRPESSKGKGSSKSAQVKEQEREQVIWTPAPIAVGSWADIDDDDDYYATTAPLQTAWATSEPKQTHEDASLIEEV